MDKAFSTYLDAVRFLAACLVYLWHSNQRALIEPVVPFSGYGHSAVIVFFVLSGFVIAYVTDTKETTWQSYAASRVSRIYSVAVPALLLTPLLDAAGRSLHPALYAYPFDQFAVRMLASLAMLNEIWFVSITPFSNAPYWSVAYEAWYYVIFGLAVFLPRRVRWLALALLAALLGPKVLLLLPIWLAGVGLYHWQAPRGWPFGRSCAIAIATLAGIVAFHQAGIGGLCNRGFEQLAGKWLYRELAFSKFFVGDYLLCLLVVGNFAAMRNVAPRLGRWMSSIEQPVRVLAGYTFTLYLLHQPLLLFWAAVLRGDPQSWMPWIGVTVLTGLSVLGIGRFTEQRRQPLRAALHTRLLSGVGPTRSR